MLSDGGNAKNILKIYEADICQNVKNTEAETKNTILFKISVLVHSVAMNVLLTTFLLID